MSSENKYDLSEILMNNGIRRFHVMSKPGSSVCNIGCTYCYYLEKEHLPGGPGRGKMSDEVLESFIREYIEGVNANEIVFSWQGGEPTMLGLDYYKNIVELQKKYSRPGLKVSNDLQTNGILLDDSWCEFLKKNDWLVGISIDGPKDLHNEYRITKNGKPTFDMVMNGIKLLKKHKVAFNTLTCVNRINAKRPLDVYRFLRREIGSTYLQFIPIVEYKGFETTAPHTWNPEFLPKAGTLESKPGHPDSIVTDWSVDPDDYGYFLSKVFDEWLNRDYGKVLVNHIETLVAQHLGMPSQICIYSEFCGKGLVVENEGSVYSCDHYVYPEYRLGNVLHNNLSKMVFSQTQVKFGYDKADLLPEYCRKCEFLSDCWGECPKNRIIKTEDGEPGLNYLCSGLKKYFSHALPEIEKIAARIREESKHPAPRIITR